MRLEEVVERLKDVKRELRSKYKVKTLALFGLTVRNEKGRDIDILVEFKEPVGLKFFEL
ncbi:nucleotidyltransferase family protein [Thermovibrio sp.]